MPLGRWPLYYCRTIPSLENRKMALNKLENILQHLYLSNGEHVLYMLLSMETTEDIYVPLLVAIECKHSSQVFSTDMSYIFTFNTCVNHYDNHHLNKH